MKKLLFLFLPLLSLTACTSEYDFNDVQRAKAGEDVVFYATIEGSDEAETKVFADNQMRVLWNAEDQISIFNKNTNNQPYRFNGEDGDNAGSFSIVSANNELPSGNPLEHIYSVYPYTEGTTINSDGVMTLTLPAVQYYQANSFGIRANTMVSATDDTQLQFKNACGYLSFKFYGEGVSVKSITLKGNNHEKIAGDAKITMPFGGLPAVAMQNTATEEASLICDEPVALNANSNDYTEFWFVLPPTDFTQGFTVTVTDAQGNTFVKSTSREVIISRNNLSRMSPMEVVLEYKYVPFADANFKAYCIAKFDKDGDGEISMSEASKIKIIIVRAVAIESMKGIEFMPNLWYLSCTEGILTSLDVSHNTSLKYLYCYNNQLTSLDVSQNTALTTLNCGGNQLTSLDVSNNKVLKDLRCYSNQLTSLDVSNNTALTELWCFDNQLTSLDVSQNTALMYLECYNNQLTSLDVSNTISLKRLWCFDNQLKSLDVSHNTALTTLDCEGNQLTSLDVSNNTALTVFCCGFNQLTSLDVSNNISLKELWCFDNQLTSLDVSQNTALTTLNCGGNQLTSLDVSNNALLTELYCSSNPNLAEIWLKTNQTITEFIYNKTITSIKYKD